MAATRTEFDEWLAARVAQDGAFTVLIVLVRIGGVQVDLLRSTYLNVLGDEVNWAEVAALFEGAGVAWNGAAFFMADKGGGLVEDAVAKSRLSSLVAHLNEDRLLLNEGEFFDRRGRRLRVDEVTAH